MRADKHIDERGSSLLLVMIFLTSIGLLSSALMSYELSINKQSFSVRRLQSRETGANTGLEWGVNSLRQGKDGFCQGAYEREIISVGGREVEVWCRAAAGTDTGSNNVALFLNQSEPAELNRVVTRGQLGPEGSTTIEGPVYNGRGRDGWELKAPIKVSGDVLLPDDGGLCEPGTTTDLPSEVTGLYVNAKRCTMSLESVMPAAIPMPCETLEKCVDPEPTLLDVKGSETKEVPACKVFRPGVYRTPPTLAGNNYFTPGTYYFELKTDWTVASALRGGDPAPQSPVAQGDPVDSSVPRCEGAPEPVEPWGVTFVFGGPSRMRVVEPARVELFAQVNADGLYPNIATGGQKRATEWATSSELRLDAPFLKVGGGAPEFILHSGVYAPDSAVLFQGNLNATETINNTTVVGRLEMTGEGQAPDAPAAPAPAPSAAAEAAVAVEVGPVKADAPASGVRNRSNIGIFVRSGTVKKYVLMARSCPGGQNVITHEACTTPPAPPLEQELCAVASATVYDDDRRTVYVDTWRVDRDPSPFDPARCTIS